MTWLVILRWENGPAPDHRDIGKVTKGWAATAQGSTKTLPWNGEISPCFSSTHEDRLFPPVVELLNWTWFGENQTVLDPPGGNRASLRTIPASCIVFRLDATVDQYGYRLSVSQNDEPFWQPEEPFSVNRTEPEELSTVLHVLTDVEGNAQLVVKAEPPAIAPPTADLAQTVVTMEAKAHISERCPGSDA